MEPLKRCTEAWKAIWRGLVTLHFEIRHLLHNFVNKCNSMRGLALKAKEYHDALKGGCWPQVKREAQRKSFCAAFPDFCAIAQDHVGGGGKRVALLRAGTTARDQGNDVLAAFAGANWDPTPVWSSSGAADASAKARSYQTTSAFFD